MTTPPVDAKEYLKHPGIPPVPGITHQVGFLPGTVMLYIDLSADDGTSAAQARSSDEDETVKDLEKSECQVQVNDSRVAEEVHRLATSDGNENIIELPKSPEITALEFDRLLPETDQNSSNSATSQLADLDAQSLDTLLPDTQVCSPTPLSTLDPESSTTTESESSSGVNTLIEIPQKLSCRERKRIIVPMNRPANVTNAMQAWITKTNYLLDPFREDDECWFHPVLITPEIFMIRISKL